MIIYMYIQSQLIGHSMLMQYWKDMLKVMPKNLNIKMKKDLI